MNQKEFDQILSKRLSSITSTLAKKGSEYAMGDILYNFNRAAQTLQTTPEKSLLGMLVKHWVSMLDMIEGKLPATETLVNEKLGDIINYLILLEAIFAEKRKGVK